MKDRGFSNEELVKISETDFDTLLATIFGFEEEFKNFRSSLSEKHSRIQKTLGPLERRAELDKLIASGLEYPIKDCRERLETIVEELDSSLANAINSINSLIEHANGKRSVTRFDIFVLATDIAELTEPVFKEFQDAISFFEDFAKTVGPKSLLLRDSSKVINQHCPFLMYLKTRGLSLIHI